MGVPAGEPLTMIIDTDTASDDAVALVMAVCSGLARVRALTTVAGNVDLDQATRNALCTLDVVGAGDVEVYRGCERPLVRAVATADEVHGADGMSGTPLATPARTPRDEHAVDALLRLSREHPPGTMTLVAIGPLTNIAAALIRDRSMLGRFRHVYCMTGAADAVGNASPTAEYNAWVDPEAVQIVLDESTPNTVTFVGWDVSRRDGVLSPADQDQLRELGTPVAVFAESVTRNLRQWTAELTGRPGCDLPDPVTMAVALNPSLVTRSETVHVRVALSEESRGQLIVDRRATAPPPNVTLVRRVDAAGFRSLLLDSCTRGNATG